MDGQHCCSTQPWRQPRGKSMVSLVNSHTTATRIGRHPPAHRRARTRLLHHQVPPRLRTCSSFTSVTTYSFAPVGTVTCKTVALEGGAVVCMRSLSLSLYLSISLSLTLSLCSQGRRSGRQRANIYIYICSYLYIYIYIYVYIHIYIIYIYRSATLPLTTCEHASSHTGCAATLPVPGKVFRETESE